MCHSRANNNKMNRFHEKCLRIAYIDKQSSFNELLEIDGSVSIHTRNIQIIATEMRKLINNLWPPPIIRVFKLNSDIRHNLRQILRFFRSQVRLVNHAADSIFYLGLKIWDILPDDNKTIGNLDTFKIEIKKWKPENYPCSSCKVNIDRVVVFL